MRTRGSRKGCSSDLAGRRGVVDRQRIIGAAALLITIPLVNDAATLVQLAIPALVLIAILAYERTRLDWAR